MHTGKFDIDTNASSEGMLEILDTWLRSQIGCGEDKREPEKRDVYNIKVSLDLTEDNLYTSHDCGNDALAAGIILQVCHDLLEVKDDNVL